MDLLNRFLRWIDHNRGLVTGLVLAGLAAWAMIGCEPSTQSLIDPDNQVGPRQLEREVLILQGDLDRQATQIEQQLAAYNAQVDQFNAELEAARADLAEQIEKRQQIVATLGGLATAAAEGSFSPGSAIGAVVSLVGLLGLAGTQYDRMRKDKLINNLKAAAPELTRGVTP